MSSFEVEPWIPSIGLKVKLSTYGYACGLIESKEDAKAAEGMIITAFDQVGPDAWAVDVTGPLNRYLLCTTTLEPIGELL